MTRMRLKPRHEKDIIKITSQVLGGKSLHVGMSDLTDASGLGEVFVWGAKTGSHIDSLTREFVTVVSMALQYGMPFSELVDNIQREPDGRPSSVFGEVVDAIVKDRAERPPPADGGAVA